MPEPRSLPHRIYGVLAKVLWVALDIPLAVYSCMHRRPAHRSAACCVLIHSFDGYKRFWAPVLFFTHQAILPQIPLVCASEFRPMAEPPAQCLLTGGGSFIRRLAIAIHQLRRSFSYVLYLQEDMWLDEAVPAEQIRDWVSLMQAHQLHCLKLTRHSVPRDVQAQLSASHETLASAGPTSFTLYGRNAFLMSHHGSLFQADYLLKTLVFAYLMGARKPKDHEIYVSKALQDWVAGPLNPSAPLRIAAWQGKPALHYVHASDGGDLTPEAAQLLRCNPACPAVDESLPDEVFPARATRRSPMPARSS